jgi:predicted membrane-bound spermidine synthase
MTNKYFFFILAFIEGFVLMSVELTAGRMLSVYFGTSLMVWAFVLGITLLFLALGYFFGSYLSHNNDRTLRHLELVLILLFSALIITTAYQYISQFFIFHTSFYLALGCSAVILIGLSALCCGAITPLIIQVFTLKFINIKSISGKILGLSTIGGVLAVFLCAFYFMSQFGLRNTILLNAALLFLPTTFLLFKKKNYILCFLLLAVLIYRWIDTSKSTAIYESDGINGKIAVLDFKNEKGDIIRNLQVNQIIQTQWNRTKNNFETPYIKIIANELDSISFPMNKALNTALIIGYGGGALAKVFENRPFQVDGVELDQRIIDVAKTYFGLNPNTKLYRADGRTYISRCEEKYDVIVLDVFKGENLPFNLFTAEAFTQIKRCLKENGILIINSNGYLYGESAKANTAILSTLRQQQFDYKIKTTDANPDYANAIIFAKVNPNTNFEKTDYTQVLLDDKGDLDLLNASAAFEWRKNYLKVLYQ